MRAAEKPWNKNLQLLVVFIIGFNILPHMLEIPPWVTAISILFLVWKVLYLFRGFQLPKKSLLWAASLFGMVGIFYEYQTISGREAASALLVFLASSKLLETNRYRDLMLVIFTSFFLLMTHLLSSQSLLSTLFMITDLLLITLLMVQLHQRDRRSSLRTLRPATKLLAYTIPVSVFLFFFFPRFSSGVMQLQKTQKTTIGFSDRLSPGQVESLADDEEPAFRVQFSDGMILSPETLYWRGAVLSQGSGLSWTAPSLKIGKEVKHGLPDPKETLLKYTIWLEPHFSKWLFVLDFPVQLMPSERLLALGAKSAPGLTYTTANDISSRISYVATSSSTAPIQSLTNKERQIYLQVPEVKDPRLLKLIGQFKFDAAQKQTNSPRPIELLLSHQVLEWFTLEKFRYTKDPGTLQSQPGIDQLIEFMFSTRVGFCEHYAATYATLMRAMGVPSRVVVGFLGGQYNQLGQYMIVRNLDAHAWSEIWVTDENDRSRGQWVRVDPTELIAPLRVQLGGDFNQLAADLINGNLTPAEITRQLRARASGLQRFGLVWDVTQMAWNNFLLKYDFDYQRSFVERLGLKHASRWVFFIWTVIGLVFFLLGFQLMLRKRAKEEDKLLLTWRKFCSQFERAGLAKRSDEGALAFSQRASQVFPGIAQDIATITDQYLQLRYGPPQADLQRKLRMFHQSVRRFSISVNSRSSTS